MSIESFKNKLTTSLVWWLGKKKPFIINDEYKIKLLFIDKVNNSAKIEIINIKTDEKEVQEVCSETE